MAVTFTGATIEAVTTDVALPSIISDERARPRSGASIPTNFAKASQVLVPEVVGFDAAWSARGYVTDLTDY